MIVEVKQKHIDEGVQGCPCYCAVSLAVYDALKLRYKFTNSEGLAHYDGKEEVKVGESWVETACQGMGAEISIYTKVEEKTDGLVEDIIEIRNQLHTEGMDCNILEDWIEGFDTYAKEYVEPTSFKIECIRRLR